MEPKNEEEKSENTNIQRRPNRKLETRSEAQSSGEITTTYIHGPRGIHAQQTDGAWQWMLQDGLNSVRSVVDNDSAVQQSVIYDPYGNPISLSGTEQTMYGYTGEPVDANGLVYLRNRYYNPNIGTFISQDLFEGSINNPMSLNRYAYVQGNPVNMTDPSGMIPVQAMNGMMHSNPLAFANMMNAGMCFRQIETGTPTATPMPTSRPPEPCSFTVTPTPGATPTPTLPALFPTNTPVVTPIVSSQVRLPIGDAAASDAILTPYGCNWLNSNGSPLRSRDVNPRCETSAATFAALGGVPASVYAPVPQAEVMIVDRDAGALGQFVAIRIDAQYMPQLGLGNGYLYIGYSHLSQIFVSATNRAPFPVAGTAPIGVTGATGTDNIHLDIMAFFVPNLGTASTSDPVPWRTVTGSEIDLHLNSQAFFRLGGVGNFAPVFQSQEVDPLTIWPALGDGQVCG